MNSDANNLGKVNTLKCESKWFNQSQFWVHAWYFTVETLRCWVCVWGVWVCVCVGVCVCVCAGGVGGVWVCVCVGCVGVCVCLNERKVSLVAICTVI